MSSEPNDCFLRVPIKLMNILAVEKNISMRAGIPSNFGARISV